MAVLESPTVAGQFAEVDSGKNLFVAEGLKGYTVGGEYVVAGWTTAAVAAALAANTTLISLRFAPASSRKAYMTRIRMVVTVITPGANGGVPGVLAWQRFTAATPTAGNARTVDKKNSTHPSTSDMTDVRDLNSALTVTGVTFGNIAAASLMPTFPELTSGAINGAFEWIYEPGSEPLVLNAGDGLAMRTQVAMPATTTWGFAYTAHWFEK